MVDGLGPEPAHPFCYTASRLPRGPWAPERAIVLLVISASHLRGPQPTDRWWAWPSRAEPSLDRHAHSQHVDLFNNLGHPLDFSLSLSLSLLTYTYGKDGSALKKRPFFYDSSQLCKKHQCAKLLIFHRCQRFINSLKAFAPR